MLPPPGNLTVLQQFQFISSHIQILLQLDEIIFQLWHFVFGAVEHLGLQVWGLSGWSLNVHPWFPLADQIHAC